MEGYIRDCPKEVVTSISPPQAPPGITVPEKTEMDLCHMCFFSKPATESEACTGAWQNPGMTQAASTIEIIILDISVSVAISAS